MIIRAPDFARSTHQGCAQASPREETTKPSAIDMSDRVITPKRTPAACAASSKASMPISRLIVKPIRPEHPAPVIWRQSFDRQFLVSLKPEMLRLIEICCKPAAQAGEIGSLARFSGIELRICQGAIHDFDFLSDFLNV